MASSLGLSLKLSPEAISSLHARQSNSNVSPLSQKVNEISENKSESDEFVHDDSHQAKVSRELPPQDGEDWDDMIAVSPEYLDEVENDSDEEDGDESVDSNNSDAVSLSPPPTLPLVIVSLERLCGFVPRSPEEAKQLTQQVVAALSQDDNDTDTDNQEHDSLSRHFDGQVKELFENGVANHGDTSMLINDVAKDLSKAVIPYPEFLCVGSGVQDGTPPQVYVTARQWKRLLKPHKVHVVNKLLRHLQNCNRPLSWKVNMHTELLELVKRQDLYRQSQQEESQLIHWRTIRRKQQLDKLYQVRETFDHRLEDAQEKLSELEEQCQVATSTELRRLRLVRGESGGGLEALDFDTNIFSFGERCGGADSRVGDALGAESDIIGGGDEYMSSDSGYDNERPSSGDESLDNDNGLLENESAVASLPAIDDKERSRARRKEKLKTQRRRLQSQQEAAKEQRRIEQAHEEEERVREACTTPELRMAQATVQSLEERMQQVDDLLESLQEEEWADEEQGIVQTEADANAESSAPSTKTPNADPVDSSKFSLLDSILAMILGSLPQSSEVNLEEHYKSIQKEHQDIVNEWKDYFGRLPISYDGEEGNTPNTADDVADALSDLEMLSEMNQMKKSPGGMDRPAATALRESLGIEDGAQKDNWDDDDCDSIEADSAIKPQTSNVKASKAAVGLRPGGKVSR